MLPQQQPLQCRQDRRGTTARASVATAKATLLVARVPTRTRALPPPTHIIIMHGEGEAKTTKMTTQLNRRYPAEQPAGLINREPSEAPGTGRSHNRYSQPGRASRPWSAPFYYETCNFVSPMRLMKYSFPYPFLFVYYGTLARPHVSFSIPRRMRETHSLLPFSTEF